jgi:Zn-dependent protease with chaperone function
LFLGYFAISFALQPAFLAQPVAIVAFIVLVIALLVLGGYSGLRQGRKLVLEADNQAAEIVGRGVFLRVLEKVESFRQQDLASGKKWLEYGDHPTVQKRIENLGS